jgi:hypothetical protein
MKFYTVQIDRAYFNDHIKRDISSKFNYTGDLLDCYVVEYFISGYRNGELWICNTSENGTFFPAVLQRLTTCVKNEYSQEEFMQLVPSHFVDELEYYINMLTNIDMIINQNLDDI